MDSCRNYCQGSAFLWLFCLLSNIDELHALFFSNSLHIFFSLTVVLITLFNIKYECSAYKTIQVLRGSYSFCNINDTKILWPLFSLLLVAESESIRFFEGCTIGVFCSCFSLVVSLGTCSASMSMENKMPLNSQYINKSFLLSSLLLNQKSTASSFWIIEI